MGRLPPPLRERALSLPTRDGLTLAARIHEPAETRGLAVVCHPHPRFGASMDNKVVEMLCRTLAHAGLATLRFNFRGVPPSEGAHRDGASEPLDVLAALAQVTELAPGAVPTLLAGYSFGAAMAMAAALQESPAQVDGMLLVAPPLSWRPIARPALRRGPEVIVGDHDRFCTVDQARELVASYSARGACLQVIDGNDHFFHGKLLELCGATARSLKRLLGHDRSI